MNSSSSRSPMESSPDEPTIRPSANPTASPSIPGPEPSMSPEPPTGSSRSSRRSANRPEASTWFAEDCRHRFGYRIRVILGHEVPGALQTVEGNTEVLAEALAEADLLELVGGSPYHPARHPEGGKPTGHGQRVLGAQRPDLTDEPTGAAGVGVGRPVGGNRLAGDTAVVVAQPEEAGEDRAEERGGDPLHHRAGRPHGLHAGDRPRVVGDRIDQHEPGAALRPLHRGDLGDAATEVVTHQDRFLDTDHVQPGVEVPSLTRHRDVAA